MLKLISLGEGARAQRRNGPHFPTSSPKPISFNNSRRFFITQTLSTINPLLPSTTSTSIYKIITPNSSPTALVRSFTSSSVLSSPAERFNTPKRERRGSTAPPTSVAPKTRKRYRPPMRMPWWTPVVRFRKMIAEEKAQRAERNEKAYLRNEGLLRLEAQTEPSDVKADNIKLRQLLLKDTTSNAAEKQAEGMELFKKMKSEDRANSTSFTTVLKYYVQQRRWKQVNLLITDMHRFRIPFSAEFFHVIIYALAVDSKLDRMLQYFYDLGPLGVKPDVKMYNDILRGFMTALRDDQVEIWLNKMKDAAVDPDIKTYVLLIWSFAKARNLDKVNQYWKEYLDSGIPVTNGMCALMLKSYARMGQYQEALNFWKTYLQGPSKKGNPTTFAAFNFVAQIRFRDIEMPTPGLDSAFRYLSKYYQGKFKWAASKNKNAAALLEESATPLTQDEEADFLTFLTSLAEARPVEPALPRGLILEHVTAKKAKRQAEIKQRQRKLRFVKYLAKKKERYFQRLAQQKQQQQK